MATWKQLIITHQKNTLEKILNKTLLFDTLLIDEEKIFDKIIESLAAENDDIYTEHEPGTDMFVVKRENGNVKQDIARGEKHF